MPLYEYLCGSCGHKFERIQKFSDAPLTDCPSCGGAIEKLLSSPAIQFKGSGWYITDYAKSGAKEPARNPSADTSSSKGDASKGDSSKSESSKGDAPSSTSSPAGESKSTPAPAAPARSDTK